NNENNNNSNNGNNNNNNRNRNQREDGPPRNVRSNYQHTQPNEVSPPWMPNALVVGSERGYPQGPYPPPTPIPYPPQRTYQPPPHFVPPGTNNNNRNSRNFIPQ